MQIFHITLLLYVHLTLAISGFDQAFLKLTFMIVILKVHITLREAKLFLNLFLTFTDCRNLATVFTTWPLDSNIWSSRNWSSLSCLIHNQVLLISITNLFHLSKQSLWSVNIHRFLYMSCVDVYFVSPSGAGCVSNSNSSADWLRKNLGPFSVFLSLKHLLQLNPNFNPVRFQFCW